MATTVSTLAGVFDDYATAQQVAQELMANGFRQDEVQVTAGDSMTTDVARGNAGFSGETPRDTSGGGIAGFFRNLFGTDDDEESGEHHHYAEAVRRGSAVVTVRADESRQNQAIDIMNRYGAVDIDRRAASWREQGYTGYDSSAAPLTDQEITRERELYRNEQQGDRAVPVVQEELQVGKRAVQRGGVRVYSRVVDQPVEEQINLREEHVRVDRHPVNRPATEADFRPPEQVIEVTEMAEEAVVNKQARVVEEVTIGKNSTEHTETVRDTVRHTDVQVENLAGGATNRLADNFDTDFRNDFRTRYTNVPNATYETYAPAYQYGYRMASDPRYQGRTWDDIESTMRTDYLRNNPNSTWDNVKGAVRYGWEKVTGKR